MAKDVTNNVVFISRKYYSEDKLRRAFRVSSFNWFAGCPPDSSRLQCKVNCLHFTNAVMKLCGKSKSFDAEES